MSDQQNGNGDGGKDRATVAQVLAEVRTVTAIVEGHKELTESKLDTINDKLDVFALIPERVTRIEERLKVLWDDRSWKRVHWPTFGIALVGAACAIAALLIH